MGYTPPLRVVECPVCLKRWTSFDWPDPEAARDKHACPGFKMSFAPVTVRP